MEIRFRANQIIFCGDTHGIHNFIDLVHNTDNLEGFDIVHGGDLGIGFCDPNTDWQSLEELNELAANRDIRLFIQRGNHDSPSWFQKSINLSNLSLVPDYTESIFPNGKTALLVGGGLSIDRCMRTEGLDYWRDEITIYQKTNKKFSALFSHDCPEYFNHSTASLKHERKHFVEKDPLLIEDAGLQRAVMNKIVEDIEPKRCYSGHYHNSITQEHNGIRYRCININELLLIDSNEF